MQYGLIGEKLAHSYSKIIHEKLGVYTYELLPVFGRELDELLRSRKFKGLNVTIPYKQAVMPYCDGLSHLAEEIGAVNTLYFDEEGRLWGTNTDYEGFRYGMDRAGIEVFGKKVLILGDGATGKTICRAVSDMGARKIIIASRKEQRTEIKQFGISAKTVTYAELETHPDVQIIINATPVGMYPDMKGCPLDLGQFPKCQGVFDVVYNPYQTLLIQQGKKKGIPCTGGLAMLVAQATASAGYFTGGKMEFANENERILLEMKAMLRDGIFLPHG